MAIKYVTASVNALAGVISGTDITSYDDDKTRHVTGIYVGGNTAGVRARYVYAGGVKAEIDTTAFNATHGLLDLDIDVIEGQYIHVDINNTTNGAVNPVPIVVRYEVPGRQ